MLQNEGFPTSAKVVWLQNPRLETKVKVVLLQNEGFESFGEVGWLENEGFEFGFSVEVRVGGCCGLFIFEIMEIFKE